MSVRCLVNFENISLMRLTYTHESWLTEFDKRLAGQNVLGRDSYVEKGSGLKKALMLLAAVTGLTCLIPTSSRAQSWFDPNWSARSAVTVHYVGGSTLTDYQVRIPLDNSFDFSKAKGDGGDVRLTAADGTTVLPFWIESWDSVGRTANIWVRMPTIPPGGTTVYLYCGNPGATSASNGAGTFILFDDDWTQQVSNPVQKGTQDWWELEVSYPMVFYDNSLGGRPPYHMLFDGHAPTGHAKGLSESSDLINWVDYDNGLQGDNQINPIMGPTGAGGKPFAWGDPFKIGNVYHMYTSASADSAVHAQSTDLRLWTNRLGGSAAFDLLTSDDPSKIGTGVAILKRPDGITPIIVDHKYWMVYFQRTGAGSMYMAYADSGTSLLSWTTVNGVNPILTPSGWESPELWTPSFVEVNNIYYIYYQGGGPSIWQIGFVSAPAFNNGTPVRPDNVTWTRSPNNPVITNTHGWDNAYAQDPALRYFNGIYYLFYTGGSTIGNGFATSSSPEGPWIQYGAGSNGITWTKVGSPTPTNGVMNLSSGQSIQSPNTYSLGTACGFRARFIQNTGFYKLAGFVNNSLAPFLLIETVGDGSDQTDLLLSTQGTDRHAVSLGLPPGTFHTYEVRWLSNLGRASIDHSFSLTDTLQSAIPSGPLPVEFANADDATNTLDVDWMYLRKYSEPEPSATAGPLPIQLSSFMGRLLAGHSVFLEWKTVSEINNYGFVVQRSAQPGTAYQTIAGSFVPGQGTTLIPQTYSYVDSSAVAGTWYYRLKQMDLDGTVHYTEAVSVEVPGEIPVAYGLEQNYPNPFNPSTTIRYELPKASHVTLKIFNAIGQEVSTLVDEVQEAGHRSVQWNAGSVASGVYFYRLQAGNFVSMKKLLLLR